MSEGRRLYNRGSDILVIVNEDCTGKKLSKSRASLEDEESVKNIMQSIIDKYGLNLKVINASNNNALSWLKADEEFRW